MLKKLKKQLLLIHMTLLILVFTLIFGTIFVMMKKSYREQSVRMMIETVNTYSKTLDKPSKGPSPRPPNTHYALFLKDHEAHFAVLENTLDLTQGGLETAQNIFIEKNKKSDVIKIEGTSYRYLKLSGTSGQIIILMDIMYESNMLKRLALILILASLLSTLVLFFISIYLVNKALVPVSIAWDKQRQFIADASHELKTPLTIIQTNASLVLANENASIKEQKKWLLYIQEETKRMAKLIHHLIYLAKVDAKEDFLSIESFNLSQTIEQMLLSFEAVIFEKNLHLTTTIQEGLFIDADKEKVKQVLMILLDNAIKNTPSGEEIIIHATKEQQKVCYTIENTGVSIPKEQCNKIFERFYRIDRSRARESGKSDSYGLGLSIAKSIVDAHHGELFATSSPHSVVFTFCIPVSF